MLRPLIAVLICLSLLAAGCGNDKSALQAFEAGDYVTAYRLFRPLAESGDRVAQNYLGVHFYLGLGVERDLSQALHWYEKAAKQGDPGAQLNYGLMFHNGYGTNPDMGAAFMWYYASYRQGNAAAGRYMNSLADDNLLSPNQIDYAKLRARQYVTNPVIAEQGSEGSLFRSPQLIGDP
ncbi:MAG: tetratricopeptide repeat protein [Gammaproteobacteria bacterium]|nr:tetratricopeptide repeat protein [Gammaproteobacteria bacterium]